MITETENGSFRDPSGFIFYRDGTCYRQINPTYKEHYEYFLESGLYEKLSNEGFLIPYLMKKESHV